MTKYSAAILASGIWAFLCFAAYAESTSEALKAFGLIGTWSQDCASEDRNVERVTYTLPFLGTPMVMVAYKSPVLGILHKEGYIVSATRITIEKLRLKIDSSYTAKEDRIPKFRKTALFSRIGDKMKILILESMDYDMKESYQIIKDEQIITKAPNSTVLGFNYSGLTKLPVIYEKCLN
jgi:hypothetical protein